MLAFPSEDQTAKDTWVNGQMSHAKTMFFEIAAKRDTLLVCIYNQNPRIFHLRTRHELHANPPGVREPLPAQRGRAAEPDFDMNPFLDAIFFWMPFDAG